MRMFKCESTLIANYGYDPEKHQLDIEFNRGGIYRYSEVPTQVFEGFLRAESKGKYFLANIRDAFKWEKQ